MRRELHNSLSAEVLESPPVAISAASQLRQETGLKEQRKGGPLDRDRGCFQMQGAGHGPRTPGPSRRPEPLVRAESGQPQPCVQRTNKLLRLSVAQGPLSLPSKSPSHWPCSVRSGRKWVLRADTCSWPHMFSEGAMCKGARGPVLIFCMCNPHVLNTLPEYPPTCGPGSLWVCAGP